MSSVPQPQAMQKVETSPLISKLADRYGMTPKTMIDTIIATVFPNAKASIPQLMMFMQVAEQYNLNPFTKEIYAFPSKGGIVPIVPVDGWTNIINSHPQYDGVEFIDAIGQDGRIISVTCIIYRKDRNHPTQVTEYLDECNRATEPWARWPKRMRRGLRSYGLRQLPWRRLTTNLTPNPSRKRKLKRTGLGRNRRCQKWRSLWNLTVCRECLTRTQSRNRLGRSLRNSTRSS